MNRPIQMLASLAAVAVMFAAAPAEARFGKASPPSGSNSSSNSKKAITPAASNNQKRPSSSSSTPRQSGNSHSASAVQPSGQVHGATPVYSQPEQRGYDRGGDTYYVEHRHVHVHDAYCGHHGYSTVYVAPAPVVVASPGYYQEEQVYTAEPAPAPSAQNFRFELFGGVQPMLSGVDLSLSAQLDGQRFGGGVQLDGIALAAEDGSGAVDTLSLVDATLSYSLLVGPQGRLRVHGGLYSAFAPDVTFVGPGVGLSTSLNLVGPFTADAGTSLVVFPYTKVDAHAALGLKISIVELRGGVRLTALDDQGRVDGVAHRDVLAGPYLALGMVL